MCRVLSENRLIRDWNVPYFKDEYELYSFTILPGKLRTLRNDMITKKGAIEKIIKTFFKRPENTEPFYKAFQMIFPVGTLNNTVKTEITKRCVKSSFIFKASLSGKLWRKIKLSHKHTLLDLHNAIQEAFDFGNDHLYSFFMDGKRYSKNRYNCDMCEEPPFVDEAVIGELDLYVGQKILYLFDFGDMWEFDVQLVEILEEDTIVLKPQIIESKGESPEQYPSYW